LSILSLKFEIAADKLYMDISAVASQGLSRAQDQFDTSVRRISQNGASAPDAVDLIAAKNQVAVDIQLLKINGEMNGKILNLLA